MKKIVKLSGLALAAAVAASVLMIGSPRDAGAITPDQAKLVIKEAFQLLTSGKEPTADQTKKFQELSTLPPDQLKALVKEQVFVEVEKVKITRDMIGPMLARAPKLLPTVTSAEVHGWIWEKVRSMLKDPVELKVGTLAPEGTAWLEVPRKILNPHLTKVSGGKVSIKMYTGGVMGEDVDILRKMDVGQLDGCGCTALGVFNAAPEASVLSLPMLFRDYKEVDHIMTKFRKNFDAEFEKRGYILAAFIDTGFFYLWTKNKVTTLADIKKQKMMTWFGTVETATYAELGIRPTPVSVPEVVTSLNTGLVDATYGPAAWLLGTQAYTNIHYYVTQPLFYSPAAIVFSKKIQNQFRGKYPDILIENFTELLVYEVRTLEKQWSQQHLRPYEAKCMEAFRTKAKMTPVTLSAADMATIDAASKKVWASLAGKVYSKALLDMIVAELAVIRKK